MKNDKPSARIEKNSEMNFHLNCRKNELKFKKQDDEGDDEENIEIF